MPKLLTTSVPGPEFYMHCNHLTCAAKIMEQTETHAHNAIAASMSRGSAHQNYNKQGTHVQRLQL